MRSRPTWPRPKPPDKAAKNLSVASLVASEATDSSRMICGEFAVSALCVCERVPLPQSWSLNDCAVPPSSCLKSASLRFSLPRLRTTASSAQSLWRTKLFSPRPRFCNCPSRDVLPRPAFDNLRCNLFTSRTPGCECRRVRSLLWSRRHDAARVQSNKNKTGGIERTSGHCDSHSCPCRDLPARDNRTGCGCNEARTVVPTDVGAHVKSASL